MRPHAAKRPTTANRHLHIENATTHKDLPPELKPSQGAHLAGGCPRSGKRPAFLFVALGPIKALAVGEVQAEQAGSVESAASIQGTLIKASMGTGHRAVAGCICHIHSVLMRVCLEQHSAP